MTVPACPGEIATATRDGVHPTLAGLLTGLYVPHAGLYVPHATEELRTTLWVWSWESTYWLRSAFTTVIALDDLSEAPEDPDLYRLL